MPDTQILAERQAQDQVAEYDAIVIGAGISGMFMLYRLRELGMTARVFEAGTNIGGTWYWNRYPGARFDSESWTYGYSFSKELLREWDWKEHFSPQPDTLEYLNLVADKFDLRRDMQFRSTVRAAHWDDAANLWTVTAGKRTTGAIAVPDHGDRHLSAHTLPAIPGRDSFRGPRITRHAGRTRRGFHRQTSRRHRHRRHRDPGDPRNRQTGRAPHRLSAPSQLGRSTAQFQNRQTGNGSDQDPL